MSLKASFGKAERIAPLLKEAVAARITATKKIAEIEEILAGESAPETERVHVETVVSEFVDDYGNDFETAEGIGVEDAEILLSEIDECRAGAGQSAK